MDFLMALAYCHHNCQGDVLLVGNMWSQTWVNVEDLVLPYNSSKPVNATPEIQKVQLMLLVVLESNE